MNSAGRGGDITGERLTVSGLVQGVGFRPLVWQLAHQLQLSGEVRNTSAGVEIDVWGSAQQRQQFIDQLYRQLPPLANIESMLRQPLSEKLNSNDFLIAQSTTQTATTGAVTTGAITTAAASTKTGSAAVLADAASCDLCVAEIFDPHNRRYGYPFTHCCHCGPRLSMVKAIPYDRHNTSMSDFPLCAECEREYNDPANRRFHAQPTSCPKCGPQLLWFDGGAEPQPVHSPDHNPIATAADKLRAGGVLAIKGMGGIHLACDARNSKAIARIRDFKRRPHKALALMARNMKMIKRFAEITDSEQALLSSAAAPIVILPAAGEQLSQQLAPGQNNLGFMLPYTPLHHLLLAELDFPLVLTSANVPGAPMIIDNDVALGELTPLVDGFLLHNRDIINRVDDSVVRVMDDVPRLLRRARGYAPLPITLPSGFEQAPSILAMGGQKKNSFSLLQQGRVVMSQTVGELDNPDSCRDYRRSVRFHEKLYQHQPQWIAVDCHPNYFSSQEGRRLAGEQHLDVERVQHHHAHIASVMLEHGMPLNCKPVLGIALDGLGAGDNSELWGGEFLLCDYQHSQRLASLQPVAMPGGDRASREPWRNLLAQLLAMQPWSQWCDQFPNLDVIDQLQQQPVDQVSEIIAAGINSPLASSTGRLFDAVAAALGLCFEQQSYEGQAAVELEALAQTVWTDCKDCSYPFDITQQDGLWRLEWKAMWPALLLDLAASKERALIAACFHRTVIAGLTKMVDKISGPYGFDSVVLGGGVFQNRILLEGLSKKLRLKGFEVLSAKNYPANDGGLSLGQVAVTAARYANSDKYSLNLN